MSQPSNPLWRFGVYAFPVPVLLLLVAYASTGLFVTGVETESAGLAVGSWVLTVLLSLLSYAAAAVVAVALFMDARGLRSNPDWSPNQWLAGALGVVHVAGAFLAVPYVVSVPGFGYYVYRRRQRVAG